MPPAGCPESGAAAGRSSPPAAREKAQSEEGAGYADGAGAELGGGRTRGDAALSVRSHSPAGSAESRACFPRTGALEQPQPVAAAKGSANAGATAVDERSRRRHSSHLRGLTAEAASKAWEATEPPTDPAQLCALPAGVESQA